MQIQVREGEQHTACVPSDIVLVRSASKVGIRPGSQAGSAGGCRALRWQGTDDG